MPTIEEVAKQELEDELFRERVEKHKQYLRERVPVWHRLFPWKITIERRVRHVGRKESSRRSAKGDR